MQVNLCLDLYFHLRSHYEWVQLLQHLPERVLGPGLVVSESLSVVVQFLLDLELVPILDSRTIVVVVDDVVVVVVVVAFIAFEES